MSRDFDPRPWNLLTGLALATGCGERVTSSDGEVAQTGADAFGVPFEAGSSFVDDWTVIELFEPPSLTPTDRWGISGAVRTDSQASIVDVE